MAEQHSPTGCAVIAPCGYVQLPTTTPTPSIKGHGQPGVYHLSRYPPRWPVEASVGIQAESQCGCGSTAVRLRTTASWSSQKRIDTKRVTKAARVGKRSVAAGPANARRPRCDRAEKKDLGSAIPA